MSIGVNFLKNIIKSNGNAGDSGIAKLASKLIPESSLSRSVFYEATDKLKADSKFLTDTFGDTINTGLRGLDREGAKAMSIAKQVNKTAAGKIDMIQGADKVIHSVNGRTGYVGSLSKEQMLSEYFGHKTNGLARTATAGLGIGAAAVGGAAIDRGVDGEGGFGGAMIGAGLAGGGIVKALSKAVL